MAPDQQLQRLAEAVFEYRTRGRLSLRELGSRAGVAAGTIQRIENGKPTNLASVLGVARAMGMPVGALLGDEPGGPDPAHLVTLLRDARRLSSADRQLIEAVAARLAGQTGEAPVGAADPAQSAAGLRNLEAVLARVRAEIDPGDDLRALLEDLITHDMARERAVRYPLQRS